MEHSLTLPYPFGLYFPENLVLALVISLPGWHDSGTAGVILWVRDAYFSSLLPMLGAYPVHSSAQYMWISVQQVELLSHVLQIGLFLKF